MKKTISQPLVFAPNIEESSGESRERSCRYRRPRLVVHGPLGSLIRGASWKGVDSTGEIDPENYYPA